VTFGRAFKELGQRAKRWPKLPESKPKGVNTRVPKGINYEKIEREVMEAIARLSSEKQGRVPIMGTLPERMVGLALVWLDWYFQFQRAEDGGRLRLGGSVVDFVVYMGAQKVIVRVQGDYWHSLPERKRSDAVQADRLRALKYRVADVWESDIYEAWVNGNLKSFVEREVMNAK
jgi:hypothetical protein